MFCKQTIHTSHQTLCRHHVILSFVMNPVVVMHSSSHHSCKTFSIQKCQRCIKSLLISFGYENSISPEREKLELWNFKHTVSDPPAMQQRSMHLRLHVPCCTGSLEGVSRPFVVTGTNANYDDGTRLHTGTRNFSLHFHAVIFYLKFLSNTVGKKIAWGISSLTWFSNTKWEKWKTVAEAHLALLLHSEIWTVICVITCCWLRVNRCKMVRGGNLTETQTHYENG